MGLNPFIGEIIMFAGNFAPNGWAKCDGQILQISLNPALFAIIGTQYGGNGVSTFGLPDLRGRVPMHAGAGPGLTNRPIGQESGSESTTLSLAHLPPHNHAVTINASSSEGDTALPDGNILAKSGTGGYTTQATDSTLGGASTANAGSGQAHSNMQPYTTINFIISLEGIYPTQ